MHQPKADRLVQAATADLSHGRLAQATRLLDQALDADPRHPMALTKYAELTLYRKDHSRALILTDAALAVEPNFAPAWNQRSSACWLAGRQAEAVQAAARAVAIQPPNPEFRLRLAQFMGWSGRGAEASAVLAPLLEAEQHDPVSHAAAISMLGELAIAKGRFKEAHPYLDQALALQPGLTQTRMLRGMNKLRLGDYRVGWVDYAVREAIPAFYPDGQPRLADQAWQGQDLRGKTLVVVDDQGHGDAIQFYRYVSLLRDRGALHITWRTFAPLVRLFSHSAPFATVVGALPEDACFDFQCNSTSLPRWFETELDSIPVTIPYIRPPLDPRPGTKRPALPSTMGRPGTRAGTIRASKIGQPEVGLVWSGDARHTRDHLRSIPADLFLRLADLPGISFHSLQPTVRDADLPALQARPGIGREVEKATDFAETAALIARLDLVITVDTAVAHLAGALGKPVWVVLHVAPDWRWLAERSDSPWYPTARLFRVKPGEWSNCVRSERSIAPPRSWSGHHVEPEASVQQPQPPSADVGWDPVLTRVMTALRAFTAR